MEPIASIVICTYGRPESLNDTLLSLSHQTFRNFEIILISEKGDLSRIRQRGLLLAKGDYVSFIDDDVYCPSTWLQSVIQAFQKEGVIGVTGPTTITGEFRNNRDLFKFKRIKHLYDLWFLDGQADIPGYISKCGAPSTYSNDEGCKYEGKVSYLECCNMSVKRKESINVGGFDPGYIKTSEWSEPDLSFRLGKLGDLNFVQSAGLCHRPSKEGIYKDRLSTLHRWRNFVRFQRQWIEPSLKRHLYWAFIWTYLKMKEFRMI